MCLTVYALSRFGWKSPSLLYTLMDQNPSTGTSFTVSRWIVLPSFFDGVTSRYIAALAGCRAQPLRGGAEKVHRVSGGIAAPARRGADQMPHGIDVVSRA